MPAVLIRDGEEADIKPVSELLIATWQATYKNIYNVETIRDINQRWHNCEVLTRQLNDREQTFLVAQFNDNIIGHLLAQTDNKSIFLRRLYVNPIAQGQGVGSLLFEKMLEHSTNAEFVRLEVEPENTVAISFYQRHGFKTVGETENCGCDSEITALILEKALNA